MPIRVCQLITELRLSGAERVVYELARRLDRSHFEVCVAALRGGQVAQMLQEAGVPVYVLDVRGRWDIGKFALLRRILKERRVDLLHTHLFHADLVGRPAAMLAGVPHLVHTVHVAEQRFRPWQYAYARLMDYRCDRIVCVSDSVRDHHSRHSRLPLSTYTVIPNGVDTTAFSPPVAGEQREQTRRRWGVTLDQTAVLFVGRLDRQKGLDVLLAAMARLGAAADTSARFRFILAGDGPQRPIVEKYLASQYGSNCRYLGFVSDIRQTLQAADIFVLPSRWEGWPLALAEAMAAGLPCIGADAPGIRDIIQQGQTGLLAPAEDPAALEEAIVRLANDADLRLRLAAAGQARIRGDFSLERNVATHEELYRRICS